jgi:hypothetical protein
VVAVVTRGADCLVGPRPAKGLLGGFLALPFAMVGPQSPPGDTEPWAIALDNLLGSLGVVCGPPRSLHRYPFTFTHLKARFHVFHCPWRSGGIPAEARWQPMATLGTLAMPTALKPALAAVADRLGDPAGLVEGKPG